MSDLPLNETALQAAARDMWGGDDWEAAGRCYPWDREMEDCREALAQVRLGVSTYLQEAGFERVVEPAYRQECIKTPWVPVVQAESEEE